MIKFILPLLLFTSVTIPYTCKKNSEDIDDMQTKKRMLVQHIWQADEVRRNIDGENSHYIKGKENNTGVNYDLMRVSFNADGTGAYTDENSIVHKTKWQFSAEGAQDLELKVGNPYATTYQWNLVEITNTTLHNTTFVGNNIMVSARFVPVQE